MTPRQFAKRFGDRLGLERPAAMKVCRAYADTVVEALAEGHEVPLVNIGKLFLMEVSPRVYRLEGNGNRPAREGQSTGSTKLRFRPAIAFYRRFGEKSMDHQLSSLMDM